MWSVGLAQSELGSKVISQQFNTLNVSLQFGVNGLLGGLSGRGSDGGLRSLGIEQSLLTLLLGGLLAGEEGIVDLGHINTGHRDVGGGGDHVSLVHSAKRDTVDTVRA